MIRLPSKIRLKTEHLLRARLSQKHNMPAMKYYPDPRTCPLAIALREKLESLFGKDALNDVAIYQAYSEVIFEKTKQTFRGETFWADHSRSLEKFLKYQDDHRTGDGPLGLYTFDWYRATTRRKFKDITQLIGIKAGHSYGQ